MPAGALNATRTNTIMSVTILGMNEERKKPLGRRRIASAADAALLLLFGGAVIWAIPTMWRLVEITLQRLHAL